ncbi:malic oxidoreductase [Tanacetum coccineum]
MILIINGLKKDRMLKRLVKREAGAAISNSVHHSQVIISGKQVCKINEVLGRIYIFGSISQRYIDSAMRGCAPLENMLNHHSSTSPQSIELSVLMRPFIWPPPYGLVAAVGDGVKHLKVGTRAAVMTFGSYAEFYLVVVALQLLESSEEKFENCAKPARIFGLTWKMPSYYFALPTEKKTCNDIIFASVSPFKNVDLGNGEIGIGLGTLLSRARKISDGMLQVAAEWQVFYLMSNS